MVLAWKQPAFAGGADITGYFVDYREVTGGVAGQWHEANIREVSERAYRVSLHHIPRSDHTPLQSKSPPLGNYLFHEYRVNPFSTNPIVYLED